MYFYSNIGDPLVLWVLKTFLLFILVYCGYHIAFGKKDKISNYCVVSTIFYSLIQGLRWMRGPDYLHYYHDIATNFGHSYYTTPDPEPLYELFCRTFYQTGLPTCIAFVLYSCLLMISFQKVLLHFRYCAYWALPLFYIITVAGSENLVRQFLAIPFVLFAFDAYLRDKNKLMWLYLAIVPFIHSSGIIAILFFVLFRFLHIKLTDKLGKTLILSYVALFFVWDIGNLSQYTSWINSLSFLSSTKYSGYIENSERWFTEEGSMKDIVNTSVLSKYIVFVTSLISLRYGYLLAQKDNRFYIPFWFTCISIFVGCIAGDVEILQRIKTWLYYFDPILIAGSLVFVLNKKGLEKKIVTIVVLSIYLGYYFLKGWGQNGLTGSGFIWDA